MQVPISVFTFVSIVIISTLFFIIKKLSEIETTTKSNEQNIDNISEDLKRVDDRVNTVTSQLHSLKSKTDKIDERTHYQSLVSHHSSMEESGDSDENPPEFQGYR